MNRAQSVRTLRRRRHYLIAEVAQGRNESKSEIDAIAHVLEALGESLGALPDPKTMSEKENQ